MLPWEKDAEYLVCNYCGRMIRAKTKYRSMGQIYNGRWYHSALEATYAMELDHRKAIGEIQDWRPQVRIHLDVNEKHICDYIVDFQVIHADGGIELIEVKGFETREWRMKWKLLEAIWGHEKPEVRLTVVK